MVNQTDRQKFRTGFWTRFFVFDALRSVSSSPEIIEVELAEPVANRTYGLAEPPKSFSVAVISTTAPSGISKPFTVAL